MWPLTLTRGAYMQDPLYELEKPKILLVDDHPENLLVLHAVLDSPDYTLTDCLSGGEALENLTNGHYALVLMDVNMPGLDGFETARLIRSREQFKSIPIIFVSASMTDEQSAIEGYCSGAVDYITKPFLEETLRKKVEFFVYQSKKILQEQKEIATQAEEYKLNKILNQFVNPVWAILLNVQMMRKISDKDSEKLPRSLNKKLSSLEVSTNRIRKLLSNFKITD